MEIKFRAWDKHEGKWLFGYDYPNLGGFSLIGEVVLFGELAKFSLDYYQHIVFMQFTGLKDKHGKEIYVGDIVRQSDNLCVIKSCVGGFECQILIELKNGGTIDGSVYNFSFLSDRHCEVIGNEFENPELLSK